ncbi:sodium-dependent transporter [Campylobacter sp. 19-13652]|uniref:sodium-dependent transporter n=1 Tax=Campylobacter sp. 19-13652 TaxID=2840180 RepID=UPI001C74925F|nr:sodium-dependent transporter [Campylobacter sp. 19-13652]BCX79089.1 sodium-dependent transporter [Campylobacter sp. 19-13652]
MNRFSKLGYVLAVAGSAVGLGNAWKFPYVVGNNGGSAFVLLYLGICLVVGIPIFLGELSIGKLSESDSVNAFSKLTDKFKGFWKAVGFTSVLTGYIIACYYVVVIGWVLYYIFMALGGFGDISMVANSASFSEAFDTSKGVFISFLTQNWLMQTLCFFAVLAGCVFIVSRGIIGGIERLNTYMMPSLFILLLVMLAYSISASSGGFSEAARFLLVPNFSKINFNSFLEALGLAFFTMSLGIAVIITYSASLNDNANFLRSTFSVVGINILLAIMMGLIIFTFIFEFNAPPAQGPGLVFMSLPLLFAKMGSVVGTLMGVGFFVALLFAGVTSAISIIEPFTFFLVRNYNISRAKALCILGAGMVIIGLASLLSNVSGVGEHYQIFGMGFLDFLDYVASKILMPLCGIGAAIFVGFVIKRDGLELLFLPHMPKAVFEIWYICIRFIAPACVIAVMINALWPR